MPKTPTIDTSSLSPYTKPVDSLRKQRRSTKTRSNPGSPLPNPQPDIINPLDIISRLPSPRTVVTSPIPPTILSPLPVYSSTMPEEPSTSQSVEMKELQQTLNMLIGGLGALNTRLDKFEKGKEKEKSRTPSPDPPFDPPSPGGGGGGGPLPPSRPPSPD